MRTAIEASEDFLGLYIVSSIDASSLFSVVSYVLTRLNCHGAG